MLLAVDIGNTNLVAGLFEGEILLHTFRVETGRSKTVDEHAIVLSQLLSLKGVDPQNISAAIIASVVPATTERVADAIEAVTGVNVLTIGGPGLKTGMKMHYDNPREVGADRIVNAVAAYARVHTKVVVVDFGTATTFDCIDEQGQYIGGLIVPGVQVSLDALVTRAAQLSRFELKEPPNIIGKNTKNALQSGILNGYAALVDGLIIKVQEEMGDGVETLATGGIAEQICVHCEMVDEVCPNLTLDGLRLIYDLNRKES